MSEQLSSVAASTDAKPPVPKMLQDLAPMRLSNRRSARYSGDSLHISLTQLDERDRAILKNLYVLLNELLYSIAEKSTDDAGKWESVARWKERNDLEALMQEVRSLGGSSRAQGYNEALSKSMHDVRGGALSALLGRLQLYERLTRTEKELKTLFVLARDHLKIMRNAVTGLDDPRRNADRKPRAHDISLMLEKWQDSTVGPNWEGRPIRMTIDSRYQGALTECCLESAAIDRIFYNLASNASRHAEGDRLEMVVFPIPHPPGDCLRFVLSNEVGEADAAYLRGLAGRGEEAANAVDPSASRSLHALFEPEVSTTDSGFGLTVVAEFTADAFGLRDRAEALRERYVGAILDGQTFRIWFHWPVASNNLLPKLDDFHHPEQSLSEA